MQRLIIYILILFSITAPAQDFSCMLLGEGNGTLVRLKCLPDNWPATLEGYHIKRRASNSSAWVNVSKQLIVPKIDANDTYANIDPAISEQERLANKVDSLIASGRTQETTPLEFYNRYLINQNSLESLKMGFLVDYDLALIQGFGLVDRNMPPAEVYEYGLFAKFKNQAVQETPAATFTWTYGDKIDLEVPFSSTIRKTQKRPTSESNLEL